MDKIVKEEPTTSTVDFDGIFATVLQTENQIKQEEGPDNEESRELLLDSQNPEAQQFQDIDDNDGSASQIQLHPSSLWHCLWSNCGLSFSNVSDLCDHVEADHVENLRKSEIERNYKCLWLDCVQLRNEQARMIGESSGFIYSFVNKSALLRHIRTQHLGLKKDNYSTYLRLLSYYVDTAPENDNNSIHVEETGTKSNFIRTQQQNVHDEHFFEFDNISASENSAKVPNGPSSNNTIAEQMQSSSLKRPLPSILRNWKPKEPSLSYYVNNQRHLLSHSKMQRLHNFAEVLPDDDNVIAYCAWDSCISDNLQFANKLALYEHVLLQHAIPLNDCWRYECHWRACMIPSNDKRRWIRPVFHNLAAFLNHFERFHLLAPPLIPSTTQIVIDASNKGPNNNLPDKPSTSAAGNNDFLGKDLEKEILSWMEEAEKEENSVDKDKKAHSDPLNETVDAVISANKICPNPPKKVLNEKQANPFETQQPSPPQTRTVVIDGVTVHIPVYAETLVLPPGTLGPQQTQQIVVHNTIDNINRQNENGQVPEQERLETQATKATTPESSKIQMEMNVPMSSEQSNTQLQNLKMNVPIEKVAQATKTSTGKLSTLRKTGRSITTFRELQRRLIDARRQRYGRNMMKPRMANEKTPSENASQKSLELLDADPDKTLDQDQAEPISVDDYSEFDELAVGSDYSNWTTPMGQSEKFASPMEQLEQFAYSLPVKPEKAKTTLQEPTTSTDAKRRLPERLSTKSDERTDFDLTNEGTTSFNSKIFGNYFRKMKNTNLRCCVVDPETRKCCGKIYLYTNRLAMQRHLEVDHLIEVDAESVRTRFVDLLRRLIARDQFPASMVSNPNFHEMLDTFHRLTTLSKLNLSRKAAEKLMPSERELQASMAINKVVSLKLPFLRTRRTGGEETNNASVDPSTSSNEEKEDKNSIIEIKRPDEKHIYEGEAETGTWQEMLASISTMTTKMDLRMKRKNDTAIFTICCPGPEPTKGWAKSADLARRSLRSLTLAPSGNREITISLFEGSKIIETKGWPIPKMMLEREQFLYALRGLCHEHFA